MPDAPPGGCRARSPAHTARGKPFRRRDRRKAPRGMQRRTRGCICHGRRWRLTPLRHRGGALSPGHGRRCRPRRTGRLNRGRAGARRGTGGPYVRRRGTDPPRALSARPATGRSPPFGRRERHPRPGATLVNSRGADTTAAGSRPGGCGRASAADRGGSATLAGTALVGVVAHPGVGGVRSHGPVGE